MNRTLMLAALTSCLAFGAQAGLMDAAKSATEVLVQDQVMPEAEKSVEEAGTASVRPECTSAEGLAGGWSTMALTPELQETLLGVISQLDPTGTVAGILSVRSQVVAGMNYLVDYQLESGETRSVGLFQDLSGNFNLTEPPSPGPACP